MPDYKAAARRAALKYGLDPYIYQRQIGTESNFDPNAGSSAGAEGIAQFMPDTAKSLGIDPMNSLQALDGAAKLMAGYVKKYGSYDAALRAYNAGEGAIDASHGYGETNAYVSKILMNGRDPKKLNAPTLAAAGRVTNPTPVSTTPSTPVVTPTQAPSPVYDIIRGLQANQGQDTSTLALAGSLGQDDTQPSDATAPGLTVTGHDAKVAGSTAITPPTGKVAGASPSKAVQFATAHIGAYAESEGANLGPQLNTLEGLYGLKGQPWCAMFATTAAVHGGASRQVRTAAVADINAWAAQGSHGFEKGHFKTSQAHSGDLITFGDHHVGLVDFVDAQGNVHTIEGNTGANKVARRVHPPDSGVIVRPKYPASDTIVHSKTH